MSELPSRVSGRVIPKFHAVAQPQEWTTTAVTDGDLAITKGTKLIGVAATVTQAKRICDAHNAELAVERKGVSPIVVLLRRVARERDTEREKVKVIQGLIDAYNDGHERPAIAVIGDIENALAK
jgi:hypothetical protein